MHVGPKGPTPVSLKHGPAGNPPRRAGVPGGEFAIVLLSRTGWMGQEREVLEEQTQKVATKGKRRRKAVQAAGRSLSEFIPDTSELGVERRYVSLEEEDLPLRSKAGATKRNAKSASQSDEITPVAGGQVEMREVFGPGGMLEKSMF